MSHNTIPIYGNYHGYYTKRPFLNDERLLVLPTETFTNARVLDVGCNEGWVSCEIAQSRGAKLVVGVDIDETLIQGAWKRRRAVWSMQAPSTPVVTVDEYTNSDSSTSKKRRRVDSATPSAPTPNYFPASFEHEFGSLPIPPSSNRGKESFPHNVCFRVADWVNVEILEDKDGYDVVVAFSVSKWIHLNEGDEGLKTFFERVFNVLRSGGAFILEPQPWESYAKAKRMLKNHAKHIRGRPEEFESTLRSVGFGPAQHFGSIGEGGFSRPIDIYVKP